MIETIAAQGLRLENSTFSGAMFLEEKPLVTSGETINSKAQSWVATLSDEYSQPDSWQISMLQKDILQLVGVEKFKGTLKIWRSCCW